jgi:hypothetical protein
MRRRLAGILDGAAWRIADVTIVQERSPRMPLDMMRRELYLRSIATALYESVHLGVCATRQSIAGCNSGGVEDRHSH